MTQIKVTKCALSFDFLSIHLNLRSDPVAASNSPEWGMLTMALLGYICDATLSPQFCSPLYKSSGFTTEETTAGFSLNLAFGIRGNVHNFWKVV